MRNVSFFQPNGCRALFPCLAGITVFAFFSPVQAELPLLEWKADLPEVGGDAVISWRFEQGDEQTDYTSPATWTAEGKFGGGAEIRVSSDAGKNENFVKARGDIAHLKAGSVTVDLWIKPDLEAIPETQAYGYLFDQMYAGNEGIQLYLSPKTLQFTAKIGNGERTLYVRTPRMNLEPEHWRHIAVSYDDATGALRIFIDGVIAAEEVDAGFGPFVPGGRAFRVGNRQGPLYMPLPSVIDNFRVTNYAVKFEP